jgi:hypothetical protein
MNLGYYKSAIAYLEEYLRLRPGDASAKEVIDWCHEQLSSEEK